MAKKSKIVREYKLLKNVRKYSSLRAELKEVIKNPNTSPNEKLDAVAKLDRLPKTSSRTPLEIDVLKLVGPEEL